jgi:hypothetical protein
VAPGVLAGADGDLTGDLGHRDAGFTQGPDVLERVVVDDLGPATMVAAGGGVLLALEGLVPDVRV